MHRMVATAQPATRPRAEKESRLPVANPFGSAGAAGAGGDDLVGTQPAVAEPWDGDGLHLHVLGSGSKGNCSVVECPDGLILVDAGITCRQIVLRMESLGLDPRRIRAIFVTHEHVDHIGGLRVTSGRLRVPVYASEGTVQSDSWRKAGNLAAETLLPRHPVTVCGVRITPFGVPHDARQAFGYRFERAGDSVGYCTDLGSVTEEAGEYLRDTRILALESNHDGAMLRSYDGYPEPLKRRIAGDDGHLSNRQAACSLPRLATSATQVLVGMHLSQHTNLPSLCRDALVAGRLATFGDAAGPSILIASQDRPLSCG